MALFPNTNAPDDLDGTPLDDTFMPLAGLGGGNDIFRGLEGADFIDGGTGDDRLFGGTGNDQIVSGTGFDRLFGGADNDAFVLNGGTGGIVDGGDGEDRVSLLGSTTGADVDLTTGRFGGFTLSGIELFDGTAFADTIRGTSAAETFDGTGGDDTLFGGRGDDTLVGGSDDDSLFGGIGFDTLIGDQGKDKLFGGDEDDLIFADQVGEVSDDQVFGGDGQDVIHTRGGFDRLHGDAGTDTLVIATTRDVEIDLKDTPTIVNLGADGRIRIDGFENISTDAGDDLLIGNDRRNVLTGGTGNDDLLGRKEKDTLRGGFGDDILTGGQGGDVLEGGGDVDRMFGGDGIDRFVFRSVADSPADAFDTIFDFDNAAGEKIVLTGFTDFSGDVTPGPRVCSFTFIGRDAFSGEADEIRVADGLLQIDSNLDGQADFEIELRGIIALGPSSFEL